MSDTIVRVLAKEAGLRGMACITTDLAREAARRHAAYPVAAAALGYGLTAGILLGALLKVQERVALKVEGDGPLRKMVIESDAYGRVRGYIAVPDAISPRHVDRAAVSAAIGANGIFTVVKDLRLKDLYRSVVAMEGGELDRELTNYLNTSEQVPSLTEIGVHMDEEGAPAVAAGLLIQTLPGHRYRALDNLTASTDARPPLETWLYAGLTPEEILARVFEGIPYTVLDTQLLRFQCSCSRDRSRQALKLLDPEDILALLAEGEATVDCHFCYARYEFSREELEAILREIETGGGIV